MITPVCLPIIRHQQVQSNQIYDSPSIDKLDLFKMLNFNPLPTFIIDHNLAIKLASDLAYRLFGSLHGRPISSVCSPISDFRSSSSIKSLCDSARRHLARLKALHNQDSPSDLSNPSSLSDPWPAADLLSSQIPSLDVKLKPFNSHLASHPAIHRHFLLQIYAFEPASASPDEVWFHCTLRSPDQPRHLSATQKFIQRIEHAISDSPVNWPIHALSVDRSVSMANHSGCQLFQALHQIESSPIDPDSDQSNLNSNWDKNGFSTHKWSLFDPDFKLELPRVDFPIERAIRGEPPATQQYGCVLPDGSRRIITIGAKTIRDLGSSGEILGGLIYVNDVTDELEKIKAAELEKARLKAEALASDDANRSKSAFLSNMSHEIRTPITVIMGLIDLLLDSNLTAQQHDYAETIKASADCLLSVIGDVLDLSKIESGKLTFEASPFDLSQLVSEVERLFSHAANSNANTLKCVLLPAPGQITQIVGDRGRIRQVLSNLISNSLKFTHQGTVTLALRLEPCPRAEPGDLCLTADVVDTGIGLTPQALERLAQFQPFSQADPSTSRLYGGTGLGLCIVKSLVDGMGGQVCLRSDGLGKGCRATAVMMVKSADKRPRLIHTPLTRQPSSSALILANHRSSYSILVADDNLIMARITATLLEKRGFKTDLVANGQEALERVLEKYAASGNNSSYDLVITDLLMPVLDGFKAVKAMRQAMPNVYLPVIALSASAVRGDREKCLEAQFDEYLTKPIKGDVLEDRVVHFLSLVDQTRRVQQHQAELITSSTPVKSSPNRGLLLTSTTTMGSAESTATAVVVVEIDEKTVGLVGATTTPTVARMAVPVGEGRGDGMCDTRAPSPPSQTSSPTTTTTTTLNGGLQKQTPVVGVATAGPPQL